MTRHVTLGFNTSTPVAANPTACLATFLGLCVFSYNISFVGTATVSATIGADVSMTYDPASAVPGGTVPVQLTYTPTPGGSSASVNLSGIAVVSFTGCLNCPAVLAVTLGSGSGTFTAPLGSDPPVTIPGSGSTVSVDSLISGTLVSSLMLAPAPAGAVPGLGGATAMVAVSGASGAPTTPIEWDAAGQSVTANLTLPVGAGGGLDLTLVPMLHWLGTSGSTSLNLHWGTVTQAIFAVLTAGASLLFGGLPDPAPITLFSGGLGPVYHAMGLDTLIGNALGGTAGPGVAAQVAAGFIPVPLLQPPLATIPPATLGTVEFGILGVSISGAPTAAILLGTAVTLTANVSHGTPPFTFAWTKNGSPVAGGVNLTDTPALGTTSYGLTVTDSAGEFSAATATVQTYDFTVALTPVDASVMRGDSASFAVSTALVAGSAGTANVTLSTAGLPPGATTTGLPSSMAIGGSANFSVKTGPSALGDFTFRVTGTTSGSRSGSALLHIYDYTLAVTPTNAAALVGGTASYTVATTFVPGSTGSATANLSISGLPSDATSSLPASIAVGTSAPFTITAGLSTLGDVPFQVTATTSSSRSGGATLQIYNFTVVVTPSKATVLRGGTASYTVSTPFVPLSTGAPTAALSLTGLPAGITNNLPASIPVGNSANFILTTTTASPLGDFPFQVVATTSASRSGSAALHTFDFTVSLDPATQTVPVGGPASLNLITSLTPGSSLIDLPVSIATTLAGVPTAAAAIGFPASVPLSNSVTVTPFTVNTSSFTPTGSYTLTATGTASFGSPVGSQTGSRSGTAVVQVIPIGQAVQNLMDSIDGMGLPKGTETSLEATLNQGAKQIDAGKTIPVCNKLDALLMKIIVKSLTGQLTGPQGATLTGQTSLIEAAMACH